MELITIGGLSMPTGCNIETIRYYERIGVLPGRQGTHEGERRVSESSEWLRCPPGAAR